MPKILIVTRVVTPNSVSVSQVVVEFNTFEEAMSAAGNINRDKLTAISGSFTSIEAIVLF